MKFKIDENLPVQVVDIIKEAGFEADSVYDERLGGSPDSSIFDVCQNDKRILVTLDLDFSDIRLYPPDSHFGIIILRLNSLSKNKIIQKIKQILPVIKTESLEACIWIVDERKIRIRGGPGWNND